MFKKYLFALLFTGFSLISYAGHIMNANITWDRNSNGEYIFQLEILQNCSPAFTPAAQQIISGPANSITAHFTPSLSGQINDECSATCQYERLVYQSAPIALNGTPPTTGWVFDWSHCCFSGANNINSTGFLYAKATMFPYFNPNNTYVLPPISIAGMHQNFFSTPMGGNYTYNLKPISHGNADSITIALANTLHGQNMPFVFESGYSAQYPLPDTSESPANGIFSFDPTTGITQYDIDTANAGYYYYALEHVYYKDGQKVASMLRTVAHVLYPDSTNNTAPSVSINDGTSTSTYTGGALHYSITVGDSLSLDLTGLDLGQTIKASASGAVLDSTLMNQLNLTSYNLAQFQSLNANGSFSSYNANQVRFTFAPQAGNYMVPSKSARVLIRFEDSACFDSRQTIIPLIIKILAPTEIQANTDTLHLCNKATQVINASRFTSGSFWSPGHLVADSTQAATMLKSTSTGWLYLIDPQYPSLADSIFIQRYDSSGFSLTQSGGYLVLNDLYQNASRIWYHNGMPIHNGFVDSLPIFANGTYWVEGYGGPCNYISNPINIQSSALSFSNVPYPASLTYGTISKAKGFAFETAITQPLLTQITVLGLMDATGNPANHKLALYLYDSNNQVAYSDSVIVQNPNGTPVIFNLRKALISQAEYRLMLVAGADMKFNLIQNASMPLLHNSGQYKVNQMLEAPIPSPFNTTVSTTMPAAILKFENGIGLDENTAQPLRVYPVPASDHLWISQSAKEDCEVHIYSMDGQLQHKSTLVAGESKIELNNLTPGLYLFQIGKERTKVLIE